MVAAMSQTAGASIASGLLSALGTKIIALLLGPGSLALLQTLQQLRDGAVTAATANGRTALVQGASALHGVERREFLRTVTLLFAGGSFLVAAAMLFAPHEIARWSRLPASSERMVPWLAGVVLLLSAFQFLTAILNSLREIGKLAMLQVVAPVVAAMVAWPLALVVRGGHPLAMVLLLAIPAAAAVIGAMAALQGHRDPLREWFEGPGRWWSLGAARGFLAMSGAMLTSGLIATAVLLAVRGFITRREGIAMTGQFDAAWNISMSQVTLILGSVQTYYLPSLAAAKSASERAAQIRSMLMLATLTAVPVIVTLAALKPLVVSVLYSHAFGASPGLLRWTLLGDYLKVSSWVLAAPMLATRDLGVFLVLELVAHVTFFGSAMLLARIFSAAEGAAAGFLVSYALYLALCFFYARARHGFRFEAAGLSAWLIGLALVTAASASAWSGEAVQIATAAIWIALAAGFSAGFAMYIRRYGA